MHLETTILSDPPMKTPRSPDRNDTFPHPFPPAQPHRSMERVLGLLRSVNLRISLFAFETLPGSLAHSALLRAVEAAIDDSGLAFELEDGRVGALVYGWRPPGVADKWVEERIVDRLNWAFGGARAAESLVDVCVVHVGSDTLSSHRDVCMLLSCATPIEPAIRSRVA